MFRFKNVSFFSNIIWTDVPFRICTRRLHLPPFASFLAFSKPVHANFPIQIYSKTVVRISLDLFVFSKLIVADIPFRIWNCRSPIPFFENASLRDFKVTRAGGESGLLGHWTRGELRYSKKNKKKKQVEDS